MSSATTTYFRSVDLAGIASDYLQGAYVNLSQRIPIEPLLLDKEAPLLIVKKQANQIAQHEFVKGNGHTFATLGFRSTPDGKYAYIDPKTPATCMYCMKEVDPAIALGIPISKNLKLIPGKTVYYTIDIFCYFGCCFNEMSDRIQRGEELYSSSMSYFAELYEETTGKSISEMERVPDKRLLKVFNGPLTHDQFHSTRKYHPKPVNICYAPAIQIIEG